MGDGGNKLRKNPCAACLRGVMFLSVDGNLTFVNQNLQQIFPNRAKRNGHKKEERRSDII